MTECESLTLSFKGSRVYVHGTDLYHAIVPRLAARWGEAALRMKIGRMLVTQPDLVMSHDVADRPHEAAAEVSLGGGTAWVTASHRQVTDRYPYDEDRIAAASRVQDDEISARDVGGCTPIELAVALTKHLHNTMRPRRGGRWMFTGLEIRRPFVPADNAEMRIKLRAVLGDRLTKSSIATADGPLGDIRFSFVPL